MFVYHPHPLQFFFAPTKIFYNHQKWKNSRLCTALTLIA